MTAKDLMWQLVFFPLWVIIGVILLWGLTVLEIFIKIRLPEAFSTTAVIIGACLALAVLLWADCALYVNLPFAQPCVTLSGFERHSQKPSPPMPPASPALHCSRDQREWFREHNGKPWPGMRYCVAPTPTRA
jgi:hypothetical protein